jgi:hypothetical protein
MELTPGCTTGGFGLEVIWPWSTRFSKGGAGGVRLASSTSTMKSFMQRVNDGKPRQNVKMILAIVASVSLVGTLFLRQKSNLHGPARRRPMHAEELLSTCRATRIVPGPPSDFESRTESDRFEHGTPAVYIKNATIWIGRSEGTYEHGDILLDG